MKLLCLAIVALTLWAPPIASRSLADPPSQTPAATPTPNVCDGADKPCYFIAIRLADQRLPDPAEQPVVDNLAKHLQKLRTNTSTNKVYVYPNDDIHISIQLLSQTAPLNSTDQAKLDRAMAAVRTEYKKQLLDICEPAMSGNFEVKKKGFIVYHLASDGILTNLMNSVIDNLDAQGIAHDARTDFPGGGHCSVGNFDTSQSNVYKDLNTRFKPWNGQKDTKTVNYMRPPYCKTYIPTDLSLMIRDTNPPGTPAFAHHYRVDKSYPLQ